MHYAAESHEPVRTSLGVFYLVFVAHGIRARSFFFIETPIHLVYVDPGTFPTSSYMDRRIVDRIDDQKYSEA